MRVRELRTEETIPLRHKILRPGQPEENSRYELDHLAVHFGVEVDGKIVSVVTAHPEDRAQFSAHGQWRIRGMATDDTCQGKGYGGLVLQALLDWGKREHIPLFWCNARERAIPFYERHGFKIESGLFEIAGIGLHRVMRIDL